MDSTELKQVASLVPNRESSLWAAYLAEREGKTVHEFEHGFLICQSLKEHYYVVDIYVNPAHRRTAYATKMLDYARTAGADLGFKKLLGTIVPLANGSTESMTAAMAYGFRILSSSENVIYIERDI